MAIYDLPDYLYGCSVGIEVGMCIVKSGCLYGIAYAKF